MILVAGGTGRLGSLVVRQLNDRGLGVRVLTRAPDRARNLADDIEVVVGDVRDPASLTPAVVGVDVVVSAVHGFIGPRGISPRTVDRDGNANLVDAARSVGADLVLLSVVGASPDSAMELFRMKHTAEQHALASPVPTTVVRSTAFLELWIDLLRQTAGRSGRPLVFGRGDNPINFVSVIDVGALVDQVITDRSTRGTILEIGGPDNLTFNDLACAVQAVDRRPREARHVPPAMLRLMAATVGQVRPQLGRQARAALAMDRDDLTFDSTATRERYPGLPCTAIADLLPASDHTRP
jgi:NADH dehydrogenase